MTSEFGGSDALLMTVKMRTLDATHKRLSRFPTFSRWDIDHDEDILPDQDIFKVSLYPIIL